MRNHFSHPFLRVNQQVSGNGDCSTMRQKGLMLCSEFWKVYKVAGMDGTRKNVMETGIEKNRSACLK